MKVCVVGPGTHFLSGISYYTLRLANALASRHDVSVVLMRRLLPVWLYPGRRRVGQHLTELQYAPGVPVFDGVDWYWGLTIIRALRFLRRRRPDVVVLQWWTGTVLHSYIAIALLARLLGTRVVVEFHEALDTAESRLWLPRTYVRLLSPLLMRLAAGFVAHSEIDRPLLQGRYRLSGRPMAVIRLGPFDHHRSAHGVPYRDAPAAACNLVYFGVIRPFKGLEDLVTAFDAVPDPEITKYWLTVVGEPWEGWDLPIRLIERSKHRNRITLIDRYVSDAELAAVLQGADAVVLPYHRSSASGPLHTAMSYGLPVVVTSVGGLPEAVSGYEGAVLVPAKDPISLCNALPRVAAMRGLRFADPHSWERTVECYGALFSTLEAGDATLAGGVGLSAALRGLGSRIGRRYRS